MKTDIQRVEWIDRYLSGELDSIEVKEFEAALSTDAVLAAELADFSQLVKGFNTLSYEAFQGQMQSWEQSIQTEQVTPFVASREAVEAPVATMQVTKSWFRTAAFKYAAAAAIILMLMPAVYFTMRTNYTTSDKLYSEYARPEAVEFNVRGNDSTVIPDSMASFYAGITAYTNANYDNAIAYFDAYLSGGVTKPNAAAFFYRAMSYIEKGNIRTAEKDLKVIAATTNSNYNEKAEWHLALLALRNNDLEACNTILNKILNQGNHEKKEVALKLQSDLKRVK